MTDLIAGHLADIAQLAGTWGLLLIFIFMTIESSFVPFPSEVVMVPAGFLAARGELQGLTNGLLAATLAALAGLIGSLVGAYVNYFLASRLGRPFLHRHSRWFFLTPAQLDRAEEVFREYGELATFVCRLLPAIRQLISIPAGLSRMHLGRFSLFTGLGAGLWVIVLTVIGYQFGLQSRELDYVALVHESKAILQNNLLYLILGCGLFVAGYVWLHRRIMHGKHTAGHDATAADNARPLPPPNPGPATSDHED